MRELQQKCGLAPEECRAALERSGGDIDGALSALIDRRKVTVEQLDPDTVSDDHFGRAQRLANIDGARAAGRRIGGPVLGWLVAHFVKLTLGANRAAGRHFSDGRIARLAQKERRRAERLKANPVTLELPPLPPLKLTTHSWKGKDTLRTWAGFQSRGGPYTSRSSGRPSSGRVRIEIGREEGDEDDANPRPPAPEFVAAYTYLKENEAEVTAAVLRAVLKYYRRLRRELAEQVPGLPEVNDEAALKQHIGLGNLHLLPVARGGHAYIGFELGCTWDEEHGAGALVHKSRVVKVGQADTSFDQDRAIQDGGKPCGSGRGSLV